MKIVFLCRSLSEETDGGQIVTKRNLMLLKKYAETVEIVEFSPVSKLRRLYNTLFLKPYNDNRLNRLKIKDLLRGQFDLVFLDGSLYGGYAKMFAKNKIHICCFYHNVEVSYFKGMANFNKSIATYAYLFYIWYNERLSSIYADKHIALNERDGNQLKRIYNLNFISFLPTSFESLRLPAIYDDNSEPYCLFVGSNFYANQEGILWFIDHVVQYINCKLIIAGSISNYVQCLRLSTEANVQLLGFVEDLDSLYLNASCVVLPIFSGSGLKTKTIEALRYGKFLLGTEEAFVGLENHVGKIGSLCYTTDDFVRGINWAIKDNSNKFNPISYKVFMEEFSHDMAFNKLTSIFKSYES